VSVLAKLEPAAAKAQPGAVTELRVRVRNNGNAVDGFILSVLGPLAPWTTIEPPTLRLPPATEGEARVAIRPPRDGNPGAGVHQFSVTVRSVSDPASTVVQEGAVDLAPFVTLSSALEPTVSKGRRTGRHLLRARNGGNEAAVVTARGETPDEGLRLLIEPSEQKIAPGEEATFRVRVRPRRLRLRKRALAVPYLLELVAAGQEPQPIQAAFEQRPLLATWFIALAVLIVLAAGAVALAVAFGVV